MSNKTSSSSSAGAAAATNAKTSQAGAKPSTTDDASPPPQNKTRRDTVVDRRLGIDRRELAAAAAAEAAAAAAESSIDDDGEDDSTLGPSTGGTLQTNLERRRGPGRRRTDFMKSAEEGDMTQEQFLFVMAIDAFKRVNGKTFPTWTDVLEVIRKLGYRKTLKSELSLGGRCEDWIEAPDALAGVFKDAADSQD